MSEAIQTFLGALLLIGIYLAIKRPAFVRKLFAPPPPDPTKIATPDETKRAILQLQLARQHIEAIAKETNPEVLVNMFIAPHKALDASARLDPMASYEMDVEGQKLTVHHDFLAGQLHWLGARYNQHVANTWDTDGSTRYERKLARQSQLKFRESALKDINSAIEHNALSTYYVLKADILNDMGRKDEARQVLNQALELDPNSLQALEVMNKL